MQPILNRIEILEMKMEQLSVPEVLEKVYEELAINKKELVKTEWVKWIKYENFKLNAASRAGILDLLCPCHLQWKTMVVVY